MRTLTTEYVELVSNVPAHHTRVELTGRTCHGDVTVFGYEDTLLHMPAGDDGLKLEPHKDHSAVGPNGWSVLEPRWSVRRVVVYPHEWTEEADAMREFENMTR